MADASATPLQLVRLPGGEFGHTQLRLEFQILALGTAGGTLLVSGWVYGSVDGLSKHA